MISVLDEEAELDFVSLQAETNHQECFSNVRQQNVIISSEAHQQI